MSAPPRSLTYGQAINEATVQAMAADPAIVVVGIGVDDHKGVFGTTRGAYEQFGRARVIDVPNSENAVTGICLGAAAVGKRPLLVHPRNDFMFLATDMLCNVAAKWRYMFGNPGGVPVVSRTIVGRGWGQGATHSQSLHALFGHFPGLDVAVPAFPDDAKGLLVSALQGDNPVVIIEHRALYDQAGPVPEALVPVPWGQARVVRTGTDVTIVGCSLMAYEALRAADLLAAQGISAEVVDPRTVRPLDTATILASLRKTGHLVVADTSWPTYGFAAEIAAVAAEQGFAWLRSAVRRVALPDCPAPVAAPLEAAYHPGPAAIAQACRAVLHRAAGPGAAVRDVQAAFAGPY